MLCCQAFVTRSCQFCVCCSGKFVYGPQNVKSTNLCQMQAIQDHLRAYLWQKVSNWFLVLLLELMTIQARTWNCVQLFSLVGRQFRVSLNAFLSMSFHVVGPRYSLALGFSHTGNFSVAPAEIRDSNIILYSSIIISFGVHSHSQIFVIKKWRWPVKINMFHQFLPHGCHIMLLYSHFDVIHECR